jgi:hypothetical protein
MLAIKLDSFTSKPLPRFSKTFLVLAVFASTVRFAVAQSEPSPVAALSLPDAPGLSSTISATPKTETPATETQTPGTETPAQATLTPADASQGRSAGPRLHLLATRHDITIQPGQTAPRLSARDKAILGLRESVSLFSMAGWIGSAGWGQLVNGSPNYGTDSGAFGERLGADAIHGITHNIIGNSFFAPLFHDDPRYYKIGKGHNVGRRSLYALTRVFVTKSDDGLARPNYSLISGNIAGAALTNAYFPDVNHGAKETAKIFGTSMIGSAVGFIVTEFLDDALQIVHLKKQD